MSRLTTFISSIALATGVGSATSYAQTSTDICLSTFDQGPFKEQNIPAPVPTDFKQFRAVHLGARPLDMEPTKQLNYIKIIYSPGLVGNDVFRIKGYIDAIELSYARSGRVLRYYKLLELESIDGVFDNPLSPGGVVIVTSRSKSTVQPPLGLIGRQILVIDRDGNSKTYILKMDRMPRFNLVVGFSSSNESIIVGSEDEYVALTNEKITNSPKVNKRWYQIWK